MGVLLLAFSFYLNSQLSWMTELKFIMLSLYLRGLGMGLLFTALHTSISARHATGKDGPNNKFNKGNWEAAWE